MSWRLSRREGDSVHAILRGQGYVPREVGCCHELDRAHPVAFDLYPTVNVIRSNRSQGSSGLAWTYPFSLCTPS